jgi:hypothetical protein
MKRLSRREFLRSVGMVGAGLVCPDALLRQVGMQDATLPPPLAMNWDGSSLGRILLNVMTVYVEPTWRAKHTGFYYYNDVVPILGTAYGEGLYSTNPIWLLTDEGYIYSSWVQPVADQPTNPAVPIGEGGAWGEVVVPITWARNGPGDDAYGLHRVYYSQVQRITGMENGRYHVAEIYGGQFWLDAAHVRIIPPEEVAPISPHIPPEEKRIEVSVRDQMVRAYEGDTVVFTARAATGVPDSPTSFGEFRVMDKRHGQRMIGGQTGGGYNLPGIPWICYFTNSWVALHGCYWHNDYGRPHSNGCVNLSSEASKGLFRWTMPVANYWDFHTQPNEDAGELGTRVIVQWE